MGEDQISRLTLALPIELRYQLQDTAFILKKSETALAVEALRTWLEAVASKKGDKFAAALRVLKEAREE
jgi:hypothetical protein